MVSRDISCRKTSSLFPTYCQWCVLQYHQYWDIWLSMSPTYLHLPCSLQQESPMWYVHTQSPWLLKYTWRRLEARASSQLYDQELSCVIYEWFKVHTWHAAMIAIVCFGFTWCFWVSKACYLYLKHAESHSCNHIQASNLHSSKN